MSVVSISRGSQKGLPNIAVEQTAGSHPLGPRLLTAALSAKNRVGFD